MARRSFPTLDRTMSVFRDFELQAIHLMAEGALSAQQLAVLREISAPTDYRYTGSGYYLTVNHPVLPGEPRTLSEPAIVGTSGDVRCGFVVHLGGGGELVFECHTWGAVDVPEDMRDRDVRISTPPVKTFRGGDAV
jgi:hypothetical protein